MKYLIRMPFFWLAVIWAIGLILLVSIVNPT
jgi:hypothetical protein